ncbi:IS110 family RNA-guided transposase [Niabella ginsengisoli]|uniref:IS110 family transposase n=2 Tax=Niabella ginsengisoli TaxID=522298 RepID=A0ABS9SMI0_9BACT|nr:IS110 family transposase [Niabella ginsengisoli]MCH5599588.1 IS110 family transposase [Niabella ginsengisoli]MCH5600135.1 IS110 family transposase [Niabella ginsengisoli]
MKQIVKQVCGIDVAQKELVVAFGRMYDDFSSQVYAHKTFVNNVKGFDSLLSWVKKLSEEVIEVLFFMEATGVYHEKLAYHLYLNNQQVNIVLPNKISNYARSLEVKTVTDKTASEAITQFGLERKSEPWSPPDPVFKQMRQLVRERDQIVQARTVAKNQLHAEQAEAIPLKNTVSRLKKQITFFDKQITEVVQEINVLIKSNEKIKVAVDLLCSIPGVGLLTASTVLAETNGFDLIKNKKQLTSYAGLDVKEKQSGTSVKGKPKISKRGNKYLRKSLHMPALGAISHDERFKAIFARLVARHGIKMKAVVAIQRKLLELMYTLYKKQEKYDKNYFNNNTGEHDTEDGKKE